MKRIAFFLLVFGGLTPAAFASPHVRVEPVKIGDSGMSLVAPPQWRLTATQNNKGNRSLAAGFTYDGALFLQNHALVIQAEACDTGDADRPSLQPSAAATLDFTGKTFTSQRIRAIHDALSKRGRHPGSVSVLAPGVWIMRGSKSVPTVVARATEGGGCVLLGAARGERGQVSGAVADSVLARLGRSVRAFVGTTDPRKIKAGSGASSKLMTGVQAYLRSHRVRVDYRQSMFTPLSGFERDPVDGYRYWEAWKLGPKMTDPVAAFLQVGGQMAMRPQGAQCWSSTPSVRPWDPDLGALPTPAKDWLLTWGAPEAQGAGLEKFGWNGYYNYGSAVVDSRLQRLVSATVTFSSMADRFHNQSITLNFTYPDSLQKLSPAPAC